MKRLTIEQKLIAARPDDFKINERFVRATALAVRNAAKQKTFEKAFDQKNTLRQRLFTRLKTLPTASLVALIITALILTSGAVYAAVNFVPDLIKILGKTETARGTTEYFVPEFENCTDNQYQKVEKFELKKDAPKLTDEEVTKIIQAKCEFSTIDKLVREAWPITDPYPLEGNARYYGRAELLGRFENIKDNYVNLKDSEVEGYASYHELQEGQKLRAYSGGREININKLENGNAVYVVKLIRELPTKYEPVTNPDHPEVGYYQGNETQILGVIGLIKLSLPIEYYYEFQNYLTEIPACIGNEGEFCPSTGGIDVFPRDGGEGASNPEFKFDKNSIHRQISGEVTKLSGSSLSLKSSSGETYNVKTPPGGLSNYNDNYVKNYTDVDATLKIGSNVLVMYAQPPDANPKVIEPSQIDHISLLIDFTSVKNGGTIKQY